MSIDPARLGTMLQVAQALRTAPGGRFAALVGAGVSDSAGVTTGEDLLRMVAARHGAPDPGSQAVDWYRRSVGGRPDYFGLAGAGMALGTDSLPRQRYAPNTHRRPTPAHRALATLTASGHLRTILTTNVDTLLEQAIAEAGIECRVAADLDAMAGLDHGPGVACVVVKLHGDYRDIGIRHTAPGPDQYHPVIDCLLESVLSRHDLLVAGWSGVWDVAL
ncbi:MAG: SIR2 family NAD-dependent protein deacylase, partial [Pseudonocardiaceae bacterium]